MDNTQKLIDAVNSQLYTEACDGDHAILVTPNEINYAITKALEGKVIVDSSKILRLFFCDISRLEQELEDLRNTPSPREVITSALGYLDSYLYGDEGFNEIIAALKYHRDNRLGDSTGQIK